MIKQSYLNTKNLSKKAVFERSFQICESSQPFLCGLVIDTWVTFWKLQKYW